jgi:hypothetical protein
LAHWGLVGHGRKKRESLNHKLIRIKENLIQHYILLANPIIKWESFDGLVSGIRGFGLQLFDTEFP